MRHVLILLLMLAPMPAAAQDWRAEASPFDIERIDSAPRVLERAVAEARAGGAPDDFAIVEALLGPSRAIEGEALLGDWRCRTIKMGGLLPLVVYGWFKCRISIAEDGLYFEKLTGSQRSSGYLRPVYPLAGDGLPVRYIYLGAGHYGYEGKRAHGGPSNAMGRVADNRDEPGILEAIGRDRLRIGFPLPVVESDYNFLELRR